MARKKEFDFDKAVDQAMLLFWQQGYEATSIDDLCHAMNIKRGSLYNAFNDKRSLYLQSIERYFQLNFPQDLPNPEETSPKAILRHLFQTMVEDGVNDAQQRGCLMVNTITELAAVDPEIANICHAHTDRLLDMFEMLIKAAKAKGEIGPNHDPRAKAQFLINAFFGMRITSKLTRDRERLENVMNETMAALS